MDHRVIIMHNLTLAEIDLVMRAVRSQLDRSKDIVFAKSTENSLQMKLGELIDDMCEDHEYLKQNPPQAIQARSAAAPPQGMPPRGDDEHERTATDEGREADTRFD